MGKVRLGCRLGEWRTASFRTFSVAVSFFVRAEKKNKKTKRLWRVFVFFHLVGFLSRTRTTQTRVFRKLTARSCPFWRASKQVRAFPTFKAPLTDSLCSRIFLHTFFRFLLVFSAHSEFGAARRDGFLLNIYFVRLTGSSGPNVVAYLKYIRIEIYLTRVGQARINGGIMLLGREKNILV